MKIGNKIAELRKRDSLSQEELAEKLGVARQTISKWEIGETSPDLKQAKELSNIFNISLDEMVDNEIKDVLIEKANTAEKKSDQALKITKIILISMLSIFAIYFVAEIMFAVNLSRGRIETSESNTTMLKCSLDDKTYTYLIESDRDDNLVMTSGSEYIDDIVHDKELKQGESFKKGWQLVNYIIYYFKDNNGSCE